MTSTDDRAQAVMRAYVDNLPPPPVAEIIARAEHSLDVPYPPSTARPRPSGRLVLVAASVCAAIAVVAVAADRLPDRGATVATPPAASPPVAKMAPGCPPGVPMLEGLPLDVDGKATKPIVAEAGQQLTLPARIPESRPDRPLLSYTIYLMPPGTDMTQLARALSQSAVLQLAPDQRRVSPVLQIPIGLAPGTYDIVGYSTWPGPSVCGVENSPADSTQVGRSWGVIGTVVVN